MSNLDIIFENKVSVSCLHDVDFQILNQKKRERRERKEIKIEQDAKGTSEHERRKQQKLTTSSQGIQSSIAMYELCTACGQRYYFIQAQHFAIMILNQGTGNLMCCKWEKTDRFDRLFYTDLSGAHDKVFSGFNQILIAILL